MSKLAIDGGMPVRKTMLRGGFHGSATMNESEKKLIQNVIDKKRLFRFLRDGEDESEVGQVEAWYRHRLGCEHALAVNGGTSALICALFGVDAGPGDEVIIPAYTFIATAAAVIAAGAVPVVCEIDESLNMDPADLRAKITPHTKAVIPVHMRGVQARIDEIMNVANEHDILVIEDVAQANGASFKGKPLGTFGHVGCFSLQQYKVITAGEGGIVVTDDRLIYDRARMQHDSAARFWEGSGAEGGGYDYVISGENYRLSELGGAVALAQRERLDPIVQHCRAVKSHILEGISEVSGITMQDVPDPSGECGITLSFLLPTPELAKKFAKALLAENIGCGTVHDNSIPDRHIYANWPFMMSGLAEDRRAPWKSPFYKGDIDGYAKNDCQRSLDILGRAVMLMIDQTFTLEDADLVSEGIRKVADAIL